MLQSENTAINNKKFAKQIILQLVPILLLTWVLASCSKDTTTEVILQKPTEVGTEPVMKPNNKNLEIVWDHASLKRISIKNDPDYNGYPRMIQLADHSLFIVYFNSAKGIMGSRSIDYGINWELPFIILPNSNTHAMDNPEILLLQGGSLLISTNLRPFGSANNHDSSRHFQIGVIKSNNNGKSWSPISILYSASWKYTDGCWEPKAIQLPSGEVQLYFANEAPYIYTSEQDISMLSSSDNGETWTADPVIVSFRSFFRDGMPAPMVLKGSSDVVLPIEDNGYGAGFKISIIRSPISDGWSKPIPGNSPKREYALQNILPKLGPYAGAPYIAQLPSGETVLSYQSPFGRKGNSSDPLQNSIPHVVIGDAEAKNFRTPSIPFDIPEGRSGLWNSIIALDNGDIIVLTSTNGLSSEGRNEVWMIKGKLR